MTTTNSEQLFAHAQTLFPGGVNSPVRAFKSVGGTPRIIERGEGAYVIDVDGNRYLDYVQSWGPLVLGHAHPSVVDGIVAAAKKGTSFGAPTSLENDLAQLIIEQIPSMEMVRFTSSGTEATMSALRLARAYTGRNKFIKFSGGYHGHADPFLAQAGSGMATFGLPDSPGVPHAVTADTIVIAFNDIPALRSAFNHHNSGIAAVFIEPILANMGVIFPKDGFLQTLQELCKKNGSLLIFDEVITGFRVHMGGAQSLWQLEPDLTTLGKVIGGGLPVAAYGGRKDIMRMMAPSGSVYQAGTLSGNPLSMAGGIATLTELKKPGVFDGIVARAGELMNGLNEIAKANNIAMQNAYLGSVLGMFFLKEGAPAAESLPIRDFLTAKQWCDTERYSRFFHFMLDKGFYFAPSAFEAGFISAAHTSEEIAKTLKAIDAFMKSEH